jgi:hypothetical protein
VNDPPEHLDTGIYEREAQRRDPVTKWIRDNVTWRGALSVIGAVLIGITSVVTAWLSGMSHISSLEKSVVHLTDVVERLEKRDTATAVLEQQVKDMKERFDRFDSAVEQPDPRLRRRHAN